MGGRPSKRFVEFVAFKCRTLGTGGVFIGPEWAKPVYHKYRHFFHEYHKQVFLMFMVEQES